MHESSECMNLIPPTLFISTTELFYSFTFGAFCCSLKTQMAYLIIIFVYWRKPDVRSHQYARTQFENKLLKTHNSRFHILKREHKSKNEIIVVF